ncbi:MAG: DNA polymerase III subunit alpha [Rikenellaceae bacterium]
MTQFTHLHVHTQYSILDGASDIKKLLKRAKELEMESIAITDHGSMFGVKLFHQEANKLGIKPILGCEVYIAPKSRHTKNERSDRGYHLILLAKNSVGYHNLAILASYAYTDGFYYNPRIDWDLLSEHHEGLICCSACLGGEVPQNIMKENFEEAENTVNRYKALFGEDYYLEMQMHPRLNPEADGTLLDKQKNVNRHIIELGKKCGVKCIASNDSHFINADDAEAHDHLICLSTGRDLDDEKRMRYSGSEYLKSGDEMVELFADYPEAISNTQEIADKIENYSLSHAAYMPDFPLPESFEIDLNELKRSFKETFLGTISATKDKEQKAELEEESKAIFEQIDSCSSVEELETLANNNSWNKKFNSEAKFPIAKQFLYLKHITHEGAIARYGEDMGSERIERIEFELETIEKMGFPGYFLIVWDFIRAGREMGVAVGPGRGSAAGSVVAYCLGITNIDPLAYDLLFERFLNPERISMPDVDIDFDEDGRELVMKYVVDKYGQKRVAHIITFGTMAAKMAIRDVGRVEKLPLQESDRLAKLIPEKPGTKFADAFRDVPELAAERESTNPLICKTLQLAEKLEGVVRQTGVHACGVIIGKDDLEKFIPISTAKDAELFVVQYDGKHVEDVGLLKMDFLGLKTLSIIKDAVENVALSQGIEIDIDKIPIDDAQTYEVYSRGETTGLFQFESAGMKKYLRELKPNRFEDLIAMAALYRPGPMDYIPDFIKRKHGLTPIKYDLDAMEEYLKDTYGITVYQEQVMLLSQKLAGFTKGQADTLRKAMGKKQIETLNKMKGQFIEGATNNGHDPKICEKIWTDWEKFASYAFNKSHSTCYAYVSYQTGYMKAHYPAEFMAALLSRNLSDIKKISIFMDECKRMNLSVKGPDINHSYVKFSVDKQSNVRFGLGAIKGVGEAATIAIINERKRGGEYIDIYDFVERVNLQAVNKKTIENLAMAGAFDSMIDFERCTLFSQDKKGATFIESLIKYGNNHQSDSSSSANSLFADIMDEIAIERPKPSGDLVWSQLETLNKEKELVGIYLSAHPLDTHRIVIDNFSNMELESLKNTEPIKDREFVVCGMVTNVYNGTTKKGDAYGRITVEDFTGNYEFALFSKDFEQFRSYCYTEYQLMIRGRIAPRFKNSPEYTPKINSIMTLREAKERLIKEIVVTVPIDSLTPKSVDIITNTVTKNSGTVPISFKIEDRKSRVTLSLISKVAKVEPSMELFNSLKDLELMVNCK